uniref:C-type lectin domain-containing protein n=1 Tax=Oreochromis niloticus TaxID=8128 RepID=A0A669DVC7_ORENI
NILFFILTETLSKIKPCSTVQPTCPGPKVISKLWILSLRHKLQANRCCNLFKDDPCYKCEEGWEQHGGKCYYFSIRKSSWEQSRDECRAKGGDLVKIESREEDVMTEAEDKFWIGLTDSAVEGRWVWVDGSPLNESLKFWWGNDPDNWKGHNGEYPDGEDCARMGEKGGADDLKCWFDAFCSKPHRSICEKAGVKGQIKNVCD